MMMMIQSMFCVTAIAPLALSAAVRPASVVTFSKRATEPAPVVVEPSQQWDGNDGPWSSFVLQVGTPAQQVRVDISIGGQETWVVDSGACGSSGSSTSNDNCADGRGGVFNIEDSSSWKSTTTIWNNSGIYKLSGLIPQKLGIDGNGQYGFESIGLSFDGTTSPTLEHTVTAAFNTTTFSIGQFGVSPNPTYFTGKNNNGSVFNDPQQSFLSILDSTNHVSSRSYSFTAGSQARRKSVKNALGSFIFGGYDMSLKGANDTSFDFAPDEGRELVVGIRSITKTGNGTATELLPEAVLAALDSSQSNIWLPLEACQKFEDAFALSWNSEAEQYLVNSTLHDRLVEENPSVTFRLGNGASGGPIVDIVFPYGAFDLTMSNSSADSKAYFPLKRADNETQYTLGRTFFQEAYIIADYDRSNFSLSQRVWNDSATRRIVAIHAEGVDESSSKSTKLTTGAIVGVVVGVLITLGLFATGFYFWHCRSSVTTPAVETNGTTEEPRHSLSKNMSLAPEVGLSELEGFEMGRPDKAKLVQQQETESVHELGDQEVFEMDGGSALTELPASVPANNADK